MQQALPDDRPVNNSLGIVQSDIEPSALSSTLSFFSQMLNSVAMRRQLKIVKTLKSGNKAQGKLWAGTPQVKA